MITVYVGDNNESLARYASKQDSNAYLVNNENYHTFLLLDSCTNVTVYTSLSDLPKITDNDSPLFNVLNKADKIFYHPPNKWSDGNKFSKTSQQSLIEYFLNLINIKKNNVVNLNLSKYQTNSYINLVNTRTTNENVVWASGCGITQGLGVPQHSKFSALVAKELQLTLVDISKSASSIDWSRDQILRSDIREGDIILWGLTSEYKTAVWNPNDKTVTFDKPNDIETQLYRALTSIHQVINMCNKLEVKLILLPISCSEQLMIYLSSISNFSDFSYQTKPFDYSEDGIHAGVLQHQKWANECLSVLIPNKIEQKTQSKSK